MVADGRDITEDDRVAAESMEDSILAMSDEEAQRVIALSEDAYWDYMRDRVWPEDGPANDAYAEHLARKVEGA